MSHPGSLEIREEQEALIQFLYLAQVGLAQADLNGTIGMINPISAQLLMPLSRDGNLANLFTALKSEAPSLRHLCAQFPLLQGAVCDAMYIHQNPRLQGKSAKTVVSLTIVKLDESRLMAVLSDVTQQVRREREIQTRKSAGKAPPPSPK